MGTRAQFDWTAVKADPLYRQYRQQRMRFVLLLLGFSGLVFFPLPVLAALAPEWLAVRVTGHLNVGVLLVLMQFLAAGLVAWGYTRRANRVFDPAAEQIFFHSLDHYKKR